MSVDFACKIGDTWFDFVEAMEAKGILNDFKEELGNKTLVGEYIGNQEHQHMVLYERITIIFYAIVDNASPEVCIPTDIALTLFTKYGLDKVSVQSLGLFNNYDSLCNGLYNIFRDVAKSKIIEEEEGSVLYFIKRGIEKDEVLSMCKLKTVEYRLFRKMREKLRNYYKPDKNGKV